MQFIFKFIFIFNQYTLSNCGNDAVVGIYTFNISNLLMDGVSIENSLGYGFLGLNVLGQLQFVRSSFIANNQFVKDTLMKTNVGSLWCNDTDYDYNTANFNNVSTDCSAAIFAPFLMSRHMYRLLIS